MTLTSLSPEWMILLPFALAIGLDVYLVLLLIPLFPLFPGVDGMPGELGLLESRWTMGAAAVLYLAGWCMERHRFSLLLWQSLNFPVRIVAAGLLTLLLFPQSGGWEAGSAALLAAGIAGTTQALRMGWGTVLDHGEGPIPRRPFRAAVEDTVALGLVWLALLADPRWGATATLLLFLPALVFGAPAFRAARFTWPLLRGVALSLGGGEGWRPPHRFPVWLRRTLKAGTDPLAQGLRGTSAALAGSGQIGPFRDGWLVISGEGPALLYRSATRIWEVPLGDIRLEGLQRRSDLLLLRFEDGDRLLVPRGGPGADALAAEFRQGGDDENL